MHHVHGVSKERMSDHLEQDVTDGCELPGGYWELNLCPLQEQQTAELPFQPHPLSCAFQVEVSSEKVTKTGMCFCEIVVCCVSL